MQDGCCADRCLFSAEKSQQHRTATAMHIRCTIGMDLLMQSGKAVAAQIVAHLVNVIFSKIHLHGWVSNCVFDVNIRRYRFLEVNIGQIVAVFTARPEA